MRVHLQEEEIPISFRTDMILDETILSRDLVSQERNKFGEVVIQCDWCGKPTTRPVWSYYGNYCSKECKIASGYTQYIGFLILTVLILSIDILVSIHNPSYWSMLAATIFVFSITVVITAQRIRTGYRMHKTSNEDAFW